MNPTERQHLLNATTATLGAITHMIETGNLARLHDAQPGLRAATYDPDHVTRNSISDPTGRQAIGSDDATNPQPHRPDPTVKALRDLDDNLIRGYRALDATRTILANWGPPRAATEADRLALARSNAKPEPFCEHHATITEPHGDLPCLMPPWKGMGPTTVAGRLTKPQVLCKACYDFVSVQGVLPTEQQLVEHRDRGRWTIRDTKGPKRRSA